MRVQTKFVEVMVCPWDSDRIIESQNGKFWEKDTVTGKVRNLTFGAYTHIRQVWKEARVGFEQMYGN
jgi:hypothetical protein